MANPVKIPDALWERMARLDGHFDYSMYRHPKAPHSREREWQIRVSVSNGMQHHSVWSAGRDAASLLTQLLDEAEAKWPPSSVGTSLH